MVRLTLTLGAAALLAATAVNFAKAGPLDGASGAELKMAFPQMHKIQFLPGGAARVAIWDGHRYRPRIFTSVESRDGSRICLARTRAGPAAV